MPSVFVRTRPICQFPTSPQMGESIKVFFEKKGPTQLKQSTIHFLCCVPVSFSNVCFFFFYNQIGGVVFFFCWPKNRVFFYCSREIFTKDVSVAFTMSLKDPLVFFSNATYSAFVMDVNQTSLLQFFLGTSHEIYGSTSRL